MCSKYRMTFRLSDKPYRVCCSCYYEYKKDGTLSSLLHDSAPTPHAIEKGGSATISMDDLQLLRVIGRGSFGKVLLVRNKNDKRVYALKILQKSQIVARNQIEHTKSEREILEKMDSPFLCGLAFAFQTEDKLFMGMPFLAGGPLFYHLQKVGKRRGSQE